MPLRAVEHRLGAVLDRQLRLSMALGHLFWMSSIKHGVAPSMAAPIHQAQPKRVLDG